MAAQTEPVFTTSREFDAPRDLVWAAWTDPKHLMHWFGPKGTTIVKCEMDLRPGGIFHYAMKSPDGKVMWGKWIIREVKKPERLTVVVSFSDEMGGVARHPLSATWPLATLSTMILTEHGNKTRLTLNWSPLDPTEEERKTFAASMDGMKAGWGGTMDQLDAYLAKTRAESDTTSREHTMNSLNAYLHFNGNCEEAFKFYEKALSGKIVAMMKYKDTPMPGQTPAFAEKIIHARIQYGSAFLMGSDAPPDRFHKPQGFSVSVNCDAPADADRVYNALSAGGNVIMPIAETFWAQRFGMFIDKFGIPWMVNCEKHQ